MSDKKVTSLFVIFEKNRFFQKRCQIKIIYIQNMKGALEAVYLSQTSYSSLLPLKRYSSSKIGKKNI